jgi:tRNA (guanine10-N2)-dimethyltransferase
MKYLFELSKEHKTLPIAEILASLDAEEINYKISESNEDVLIIETNSEKEKIQRLAKRLSLAFYVDLFMFSCKPSIGDINTKASGNTFGEKCTIAVRCKNRSENMDSKSIMDSLADIYTKNRKVSLDNPDIEIRGLITDSTLYVGLKIAEIDSRQFRKRKAQNRPFFSPISMDPKIARAIVNLSSIKRNEVLLDPFCGTGGILIEAGLIGAKVVGSDIENKMIEGCKKTLDFYNVKNYNLFCSDIGEINKHVDVADAIVTDLPYGKSTTTKGEKIDHLYERAFENFSKLLKRNGKAVVGLSDKRLISVGEKYLSLMERHELRVHRSLTRYFAVYKK